MIPEPTADDLALVAAIREREEREAAREAGRAREQERQAKREAAIREKIEALKEARRHESQPGALGGSSPMTYGDDGVDDPIDVDFARLLGY